MLKPKVTLPYAVCCAGALLLAGCGGGNSASTTAGGVTSDAGGAGTGTTTSAGTTSNGAGPSSTNGSGASGSGTSGTSSGSGATGTASPGSGPAAALAAKLGTPSRFLVGLGAESVSTIETQALRPDIYEQYLVGAGSGDWTTWNSPAGAYVGIVASEAEQVGAVPMLTLYQMATNGDGNLADITDSAFMTRYWSNVRLMYQQIAAYGKPVLVVLEPDFWGYAERLSDQDPTALTARVTINADCASLSNDIVGIAACLLKMARQYAPQAYVGFPPSDWGGNDTAEVVAFMQAIGAQHADFIVMQTLDRDAGCFEQTPQPADCVRSGGPWYWDESNRVTPNFSEHLASVQQFHDGLGELPVIWWQTPLGVPSDVPGGTPGHYRDDREHYFLTHPSQLVAVGGLAVVFSAGEGSQTTLSTDGGQFQTLSGAYLNAPSPLP